MNTGPSPWLRAALWIGHAITLIGAGFGALIALAGLTGRITLPVHVALPRLFPFAEMSLTMDGLSAFFLLVVSLGSVAAALYGPAYLGAHARAPLVQTLALNAFVACMGLLCCAGDALSFLLFWEGMTLASYVIVVCDTENAENTGAGLLYIVMAHAGTALLLVAFLSLTERAGSLDFPALRRVAESLEPRTRTVLFMVALTGFGAKAGVVPLHVWLPKAHPAAPSHASALMSGVMLKVAIYGILRFAFDLLAPAGGRLPAAWGWTVLVAGTLSAVIGVLLALQQQDLKRLLAFSSVENVGIILIGIGAGMLLHERGGAREPLALLALTAALLHTVNHAAFKGLLFLGAGSVLRATHTRNMEQLGGLARRMPWTAWLFLLGAVAISALPPLNGFVSEWMTFQALVLGGAELGGASGLLAVFAASMLALTGGLAAACFAKAFGVTFLGRPRSTQAERATEAPASMIVAMLVLASACVALGLAPGWAVRLLDRPTAELLGGLGASQVVTARGPWILSTGASRFELDSTSISLTAMAALFALLGVLAWVLSGARRAPRRLAPTWTCGMTPTSRFDYSAMAFAKPLRMIFAAVYRPRREVTKSSSSPYVVDRMRYTGEVTDLAETMLYTRLQRWIAGAASSIRTYSTGRIHGYIAYVLVTLFITLLFFGRG